MISMTSVGRDSMRDGIRGFWGLTRLAGTEAFGASSEPFGTGFAIWTVDLAVRCVVSFGDERTTLGARSDARSTVSPSDLEDPSDSPQKLSAVLDTWFPYGFRDCGCTIAIAYSELMFCGVASS